MAPRRWGDDLNVKFMELYKEKECLWNQFDPLYKNKVARETALREIEAEMNLDDFGVAEIKAKIKSLRGTYNLELEKQKKMEISGSGSGGVYVPNLKWFNIMKDVMEKGALKRRPQTYLTPQIPSENDVESKWWLEGCSEPNDSNLPPEDPARYLQPAEGCTAQNSPSQEDLPHQPPIKKLKPSTVQQIASTARQLQQLCDSCTFTSEPNEFDIFGNLVAARLEKLSPLQAIAAEMKMLAVLNECHVEDLKAQAPAPSTRSSGQTPLQE